MGTVLIYLIYDRRAGVALVLVLELAQLDTRRVVFGYGLLLGIHSNLLKHVSVVDWRENSSILLHLLVV